MEVAEFYVLHCSYPRVSQVLTQENKEYRICSIKPPSPGAYLISNLPEGGLIERGLIREGGLFIKSSDKDIFGSFSVLLSHILRNQHTILRLKYINSTQF